ncbi:MAG: ribosomal protein S18-alanine N-acetyltransferase [Oscillospiraceae bacterium]|nr:ribosomal protein S18-alanine N-acetyltransferase [Oscillospiraceae bacterium]
MMQKADILKADVSDIPEIALIEEKYIPNGWSEKAFSDWTNNQNTVIFKAVLDGEIIGFANGSWVLDEAELLNIAVVDQARRKGVAAMLLDALENYFMEKNAEKIFLEVREKNLSAINFYEKHGFVKNGLRKNYYSNPIDNGVLMTKIIKTGE